MWITITIILIVILDQLSKYFATLHLYPGKNADFIPGLLSFRYHENKGAAWGMFSDNRWVFMSASVLAICLIIGFFIYLKIKNEKIDPLLALSLAFFCGGGLGNMIDRVANGYVVDFFKFEFIDFPIFNVADSFITVGAVLIVFYLILDTIRDLKKKKAEKTNV